MIKLTLEKVINDITNLEILNDFANLTNKKLYFHEIQQSQATLCYLDGNKAVFVQLIYKQGHIIDYNIIDFSADLLARCKLLPELVTENEEPQGTILKTSQPLNKIGIVNNVFDSLKKPKCPVSVVAVIELCEKHNLSKELVGNIIDDMVKQGLFFYTDEKHSLIDRI